MIKLQEGKTMRKIEILIVVIILIALAAPVGCEDDTESSYHPEYWNWWRTALKEAGVPEQEHTKCMRWAFGDNFLSIRGYKLSGRWNQRHPDLFVMYGSDDRNKAIYKVGKAWMTKKEQS